MEAENGLSTLKNILFEEEKAKYQELNKKLKEVNLKIDESLRNRDVPEGELTQIVTKMIEVMPEKLGPTITSTLKVQIKESKDEVAQALFPIIGQMIKRYVAQEIAILSEKIDQQVDHVFSIDLLKLRVKALFSSASYSDLILQKSNEPQIQQVFIIEEFSGLLMASYTRSKTMDEDMVAGMLTAIKSFAKDAFNEQNQQLETVSYDAFTIYIQNFNKFYLAVAMTGTISSDFKGKLDQTILSFIKDIMIKTTELDTKKIEKKIEQYFHKI